ncbi:MAG: hypothetical protein O6768_06600, partial [Planctomycetota bacterium]|nr:hypothetical protein [Planctomycetota bacterium]
MTTRHNACVVAATAMLLTVSTARADTIHVDAANCPGPGNGSEADPYCSIQTAIDNAVDTDEIVVAPGTYFETINFLGKAVTLRSSGGPEVTIIDAGGDLGAGSVVTCDAAEGPGSVLQGFTITGGVAFEGGGMYNDGSLGRVPPRRHRHRDLDDQGFRGRRTTMNTQHIAAVTVLLAAAVVPVANAVIINVPDDFANIQTAISVAMDGDEVVVAPGTYFEAINFLGKAITLRSSDGREVTTIDATGLNDSVVKCVSGEGPDTILDGFTIT